MPVDIALCVIFNPDRSRVLVARRPSGVHLAGYDELPGGKVKTGERAEEAAIREAKEEVNLDVEVVKALSPVEYSYSTIAVRLLPYVCLTKTGTIAVSGTGGLRWVLLSELGKVRFPEANKPIVAEIEALFVDGVCTV